MLGVLSSSLIAALAAAQLLLGGAVEEERTRLETERAELGREIGNTALMAGSRGTLTRLAIERGWSRCAAIEATALARSSERPAEILADEAAKACAEWRRMLTRALANGAHPYLDAYISQEDVIAAAGLRASRAALERVLLWRSGSGVVRPQAPVMAPVPAPVAEEPSPERAAAERMPAKAAARTQPKEEEIVIVARRGGGCRVILADRTLTDRQLQTNARAWAASGTPLRVVRPAGADYRCLSKIAWQLGRHGVSLFHFVDSRRTP